MLGNLISAGASLLGGVLGNKQAQETQARQEALQREFAQNGIQWKVEDAKKAGIHPLYALGASTSSYAPISVGSPLPQAMSQAGQDLSRAINATRSPGAQQDAFMATTQKLQLENMGLQNQLLASQIRKINQTSTPGIPTADQRWLIDGQGQTALPGTLVTDKPLERVPGNPGAPHQEPGAITDVGFSRTPGGLAPIPSKDVKERIEDMGLVQIPWMMRNNIMPSLGFERGRPSVSQVTNESGYDDVWFNPFLQEYVPASRLFKWGPIRASIPYWKRN